ncbi:MAG: SDR family oxidoreductase [bacterium]|nr:SDR family oxidoreductase [bacterium]
MSDNSLRNKTILIMGGTSGLGLSGARACQRAGARIAAVGRDDEHLEAARAALGEEALVMAGDAMDPETAERAVEAAVERFGDLHGLYHVAGGSGRRMGDGPLHEMTAEGWRYTLDLNASSLAYSNRAAVKRFLHQQNGGSVVNVTSPLAYSPSPRFFSTHAYAAAKAAVIGLTRSAAAYYATHNIRFNALAPGLTETPMSQRAFGDEEITSFSASRQPLQGGRLGRSSDLDGIVVYLLSDASAYVTGQVIAADGGWSVCDGGRV